MWTWIYLAALAIFLVAIVGGGVLVALRVLEFFRALGAGRRGVLATLDRLADAAERVADHTAAAAADERLGNALVRLRRSNARLAVLRAALTEVEDSLAAVTVWYPRK
jgi:hypothetical protein